MKHEHYVDQLTPEDLEILDEALELALSDRGTAEELTGRPDPDIEDHEREVTARRNIAGALPRGA